MKHVNNIAELADEKQKLVSFLLEEDGFELDNRISRRGRRSEAPLSFAQQRLWFLDQMTPGLAAYNVVNVGRFKGLLDVSALQKALSEIYARHESLRTTFKNVEGSPVQVISEQTQLSFLVEDLSVLSADERESAALRIVCQASQEPFDLEHGPLFRVRLLRLGPENHILSVVTHHIVSDGWSLGIFLHELAPLYEAYSESKPSPLPELPIQFADYAQWQREYLQGPILEKQLSYWREHLGKDLPMLELLTDRPRPSIQTFNGSFTRFHIAEDLTRQIREFCQREKITTYILFMAVYNILLSRYTGQQDILVGSPIAGRNRPETEKLIGLFINTLVLRTRLEGDPSFREVLRRVREVSLAAYDHQDVPFEKIVEELQPSRDLSRSPVFQAMLILQAPAAPAGFKGIEVTPVDLELTTTKFDLTLFLCEFSEVIEGFVEYNTDLFEGGTMERMLEHFQNLLKAGLQDPEQAIATLPLLSGEERRQVVEEWNRTGMEYDEQASIPELVRKQARRRPQAVAVRCGEEELSYRELEQRSNRLARRLRKLGVGREELVGICVERSVRMVVGLLGIMKAGGAYVPLDPSFPGERLKYMLEDAEAKVVITEAGVGEEVVRGYEGAVFYLDKEWESLRAEEEEGEGEEAEGEEDTGEKAEAPDLAYVMYTSGSTGKPKGVMIEQGAVVNFVEAMRRELEIGESDRWLAVTTISFDIAGLELYLPLAVGAEVEVVSREEARDGERLRGRLESGEVTVMQATPATWRLLVESGWRGTEGKGLKVLCGGEALTRELANELQQRGERVWNLYGPTETTIWSMAEELSQGAKKEAKKEGNKESNQEAGPVLIGKPIGNTQVYVLDERGEVAPIGVQGELCIGGKGVARGYWRRAELSGEKFVANPFMAGERMYRTGDMARWRGDGRMEYLGRRDQQVKVRGYRIELGEIESVLRQAEGIRECVVVAKEESGGEKRLVGYVKAEEGSRVDAAELKKAAKEKLPEYMVPAVIVEVEEYPLTPNGKIDRRVLAVREVRNVAAETAYMPPQTSLETTIAGIWAELLKVEKVGRNHNFFDLGGHSLLLAKVHNRLQSATGTNFTMMEMFKYPTVSALAEYLSRESKAQPTLQRSLDRAGMRLQAMRSSQPRSDRA